MGLYAFSLNDPLRFADPDGRQPQSQTLTITFIYGDNSVKPAVSSGVEKGVQKKFQGLAPNGVNVRVQSIPAKGGGGGVVGRMMGRAVQGARSAAAANPRGVIVHMLPKGGVSRDAMKVADPRVSRSEAGRTGIERGGVNKGGDSSYRIPGENKAKP